MAQEKKKYTIPKRVPSRELLQQCSSGSREYAIIASEVERSLWNSKCGLKVMRIELVNNDSLSRQFNKKKLELQKETSKRQDIIYCFKMFEDYQKVKSVCKLGLTTCQPDPSNPTCLGDPKFGVYLSRCADVLTRNPPKPDLHSMMVVFQVIKGRYKSIAEQHGDGDLMEPTPFHEGHVSKEFRQNDPSSMKNPSGYSKLFDSCQMYIFEMNTELHDLYEKKPRHCIPYAVVFFEFECQRPLTSGEAPIYKVQPKIPIVKNLEKLMSPSNKAFKDPSDNLGASNYFTSQLERAITVWHGKLCNKTTSLTDVIIKCHTSEFPRIFPILGDYLSFRTKTDIVRLKDFFPTGLYSAPPLSSKKPLAYYKNDEYLHCEMYPRNQHSTAFARLRRSLKMSSQALMLKLPFNTYLYILPTCDVTNTLGITYNGYPEVLHLLFIRKVPGTAGVLHKKEDFLLDARSILKSKTLELEKLKLTTPYGISNPVQTIDSNSKSPFHDLTEWVPYPLYFSDTEKQSISSRIQVVRQAVVKEMIMSGHKKYKHTYKTPYFIHEYGSNVGRRRSSRGLSKHAKKPGGRSTSLPLDKEQLKTSEVSDGTTRKNLEGKDTATYNVARDPRLARRRTGDFSASSTKIPGESKVIPSDSTMMKGSVLQRVDEGSRTFATDRPFPDANNKRLSLESVPPSSYRNGSYTNRNATRFTEGPASVDFPGFEKQSSKEYEKPTEDPRDPIRRSSRSVSQNPRMGDSAKDYLSTNQNDAADLAQSGRVPSYTSTATNMNDIRHSTSENAGQYDLRGHSSSTGKHFEAVETQNSNSLHVSFASASQDGYETQVTRREQVGKTNVNYKTKIGYAQGVSNGGMPRDSYASSEKRILNEAVKSKKDCEGQFSVVSSCEIGVSKQGTLPSEILSPTISLPAVLAKLVAPSSYSRKSTVFQPPVKEGLSGSGNSQCNSLVATVAASVANFDSKSIVKVQTTSTVKNSPITIVPSSIGTSTFVTASLANFDALSTAIVKTRNVLKNEPLSSIPSCTASSTFVTAKLANFGANSAVTIQAATTVKSSSTIKNTPVSSIPSCTGSSTFVTAKLANFDVKSAVTIQAATTVKSSSTIKNTPLSSIPSCTGSSTFVAAKLANFNTKSAVTVQTATTVESSPVNNTPSFIASNAQAFENKSAVREEPAQSENHQNQWTLGSAEKVAPKSDSSSSSLSATKTAHSVCTISERDSIVSSSEAQAKFNDTSKYLANSSADQASAVSDIASSKLHSHKAEQIETLPIQTQPPTVRVFPTSSTKVTLSSQIQETPNPANTTDHVSIPIPEKASAPKSSSHSSAEVAVSSSPIRSSISEKLVLNAQTPVEKSDSQSSSAVWQRAKAQQQHAANLINNAEFSVLAHQQALMQQRHAYQLVQNRWNSIDPHLRQQSAPCMILPHLNVQQKVAFQPFPAQPLIPHSMQRFIPNLPGALRHGNAQVPLPPFPSPSLVGKDGVNMQHYEARELDPRHADLSFCPQRLNDAESCKKFEYTRDTEQSVGVSDAISEAMALESQSNNGGETVNKDITAFDSTVTGSNASANINVLELTDTGNDPVDNDLLVSKGVNGKCSLPQRRPSKEEHLQSELHTERLGLGQGDGGGRTALEAAFNRRMFETCIERDTGSQRDISDPFLYNRRSHIRTDECCLNTSEPNTHMTSDEAYSTSSYDASYQAFVKAANDVEQIKKVIEGLEEAPRSYSLRPRPFASKARRDARSVASEMDCPHSNSSSERKDGFNLSLSWSEEEFEELEARSVRAEKARGNFLHESDLIGSRMADNRRNSRRLEDASIDDIDLPPTKQLLRSSCPNIETQSSVEDSRADAYSDFHDIKRDNANEYEDVPKEGALDLHRRYNISWNSKMAADALEGILGSRGSDQLNQAQLFSDLYEVKDRPYVEHGDSDSSIGHERHSYFCEKERATDEYDRLDRYIVFKRSRGLEKSNYNNERGIRLKRNIEHLTYDDAEGLDSQKENRRVVISPGPMIESDPIWEELDNKYDEYCIRNDFTPNSKLLQTKGKDHKDLDSSQSKVNDSLNSYLNYSDTEFQMSKRGKSKRTANCIEGATNEYRQIEESDGETVPLKHLASASDLQKTQDDSVRPTPIKRQVRRVKVVSESKTSSVEKDANEEDWVTVFRNEKEEGEISTQGEDNIEEAHKSNHSSNNVDLRMVLNKMRGRKFDKAGNTQTDVYSSDNAQSHKDNEPKKMRRKVSVIGKKSRKRIVTKVHKETSDHETSSKRKVEANKSKHLASVSSDAKLKLAKHEQQRKRLYSRSDRSRKRRKSDEKREDGRRSSSSSSSSSESIHRRDESSRTRVRKRPRYLKNRKVLASMAESHHGKAHPLQHNDTNVVKSMEHLVPSVNGNAKTDRTEHVAVKEAEKHEQIFDGNKNIVDKEKKRETQVGSPVNWYDAEEFSKFDVSNNGVDHVTSSPCRKKVADDNVKEPTPVSSAQHQGLSDIMTQGKNEFMVSQMYDEVYSNISPVSDAEDLGVSGGQNETYCNYEVSQISTTRQLSSGISDYKLRDLVDVPEAVIRSIDELDKHVVEDYKLPDYEELEEAEGALLEPAKPAEKTLDRHVNELCKQLGKKRLKDTKTTRVEPEKLMEKILEKPVVEEFRQLDNEELEEAEAVRAEPEKLTGKAFDRHFNEEYKQLGKEELKESEAARVEPETLAETDKLAEKVLGESVAKEYKQLDSEEAETVQPAPEILTKKALDKLVVEEYKQLDHEELEEAETVQAEPEKLTEKTLDKSVVEEYKQLDTEELEEAETVQAEPEKLTEKTLDKSVVEEYKQLDTEELEEAETVQAEPEKLTEKTLDKSVVEEYKQLDTEELEEAETVQAEPEKLTEKALDKPVVEEYKQLDTEELTETQEKALDNADPALANAQYTRISPVDDRLDREYADVSSLSDTPAAPARDTSNIMWKLMSDSQSTAKVLLKHHPSPRFKEHPLLFNLERDLPSHYIAMQGGFVPGAAQDNRSLSNFKSALELNIQELQGKSKTEENPVDKDSANKDAKEYSPKVDSDVGPNPGVSASVAQSDSSSPDHESFPVEMELVTDEEEAQVLYIEEIGPNEVVPKSGDFSVNSIDNQLNSQVSDKEVVSMEMSSTDESDDSHEALEAVLNDAKETTTVESKQKSEDERQLGQEGSTSSKNHNSDLETYKRKERLYHDDYHHYHSVKRFGESRKSYRPGNIKADELEQEPVGRNMQRSSKEFFDKNSSAKLFDYEQSFDGFSEETKRFLKVDCLKNDELSLPDETQPTSKAVESKKTELYLDVNTDEYRRKLSASPISSRKPAIDRHLQAHRREPLYGDRAPVIDDASATRTHKALSGRENLDEHGGDTDLHSKKMTGERFQSQSPEQLLHFKEQRKLPFSSQMLEKDLLAHYNRYHWKSKHSFAIDRNAVSKKPQPKGGSMQKFLVDDQPRARNISNGSPVSVLDRPEHPMLNCDESYENGPDHIRSTPKYKHNFRRASRYIAGSLDDSRPPHLYDRYLDFDASEDSRYSTRHSAKKSYPIWDSARKSNHLGNDDSQSLNDMYDARRVYEESDEPVPYYVRKPRLMYDKNTGMKMLDGRKESFSYAKEKLTMLHMMGSSKKYRHSSLQDRGWPVRSGLNVEEEFLPQSRLYLDPDDCELKQRYASPLVLREIALTGDDDIDVDAYYDHEESRKTRRDFMKRHVSQGTVRQPGVRFRNMSPSHLYSFSKKAVIHARTEDDIIFARKRGPFAPRPIDFDAYEGDAAFPLGEESESDDDMDDRYFAEYHDDIRPLDLIHTKRKTMQREDYNEDSYGSRERPFFGEVLNDDAHSFNRPSIRGRFNFRGTGRRFSQMHPR